MPQTEIIIDRSFSINTLRFTPTTTDHVKKFAPHMCLVDQLESVAMTKLPKKQAIEFSVNNSVCSWAAIFENKVVGILGLCPKDNDIATGIPWLVTDGTPHKIPAMFMRSGKVLFRFFHAFYDNLENYVWAKNHASRMWLERNGFKPQEEHILSELKFIRYRKSMEKTHVC